MTKWYRLVIPFANRWKKNQFSQFCRRVCTCSSGWSKLPQMGAWSTIRGSFPWHPSSSHCSNSWRNSAGSTSRVSKVTGADSSRVIRSL